MDFRKSEAASGHEPAIPAVDAVREQVERLVRSPEFAHSPRSEEFLRFVVEEALEGRAGELSQRRLASRVYGRGEGFDPSIDPLVRMQAGRVRRGLEHYYLTVGRHDPVVIALPKGSYAPEIVANGHPEAESEPCLCATPVLLVAPFEDYSRRPDWAFIARGLGAELATALEGYKAARVVLLPGIPAEDATVAGKMRDACRGGCCFLVKGTIIGRGGELRVSVRVEEVGTGVLQWSHEGSCPVASGDRGAFLNEWVQRVAASIAEEQGVITHQTLFLLGENSPREASGYEALLRLYHAEESGLAGDYAAALEALHHSVTVTPEDGRLWSALARVSVLIHSLEMDSGSGVTIGQIIEFAEKGVRLGGGDQRGWCILSFVHTIAGNLKRGGDAVRTALEQNPNSLFFRDAIGYLLTLQGDWQRGPELARDALRLNPFVRDVTFCALWLDSFRRESFSEALAWSRHYLNPAVVWGPLMRAAALARLGEREAAEAEIRHLLELRPDFPETGPRLIRHFIKFEELACAVEEALETAGGGVISRK